MAIVRFANKCVLKFYTFCITSFVSSPLHVEKFLLMKFVKCWGKNLRKCKNFEKPCGGKLGVVIVVSETYAVKVIFPRLCAPDYLIKINF